METTKKAFRQIEEWRKEIAAKESKHINNVTDKNILLYLAIEKVTKHNVKVERSCQTCKHHESSHEDYPCNKCFMTFNKYERKL